MVDGILTFHQGTEPTLLHQNCFIIKKSILNKFKLFICFEGYNYRLCQNHPKLNITLLYKQKHLKMKDFLTQGQPLSSFKQHPTQDLFTNANTYPQFFQKHLVDPNRVIKIFLNDPHGNQRVFYYQYLKICEDYENNTSQQRIQFMKEFLQNHQLIILFPEGQHSPSLNDPQFKRIIYQFMDILNEGQVTVDEALQLYPIVDIAFVFLMRSILIYNDKTNNFNEYIDKNQTFAYLSSIFDIEIQLFQNCIKFTDADIFVYEDTPTQIYMAYVLDEPLTQIQQKSTARYLQEINDEIFFDNGNQYQFVEIASKEQLTSLKVSEEKVQKKILVQSPVQEESFQQIERKKPQEQGDKEQENISQFNPFSITQTPLAHTEEPSLNLFLSHEETNLLEGYSENVNHNNKVGNVGKPRLNISSQFTDSFILRKISEPFRSSIKETKERARKYRKSLIRCFI